MKNYIICDIDGTLANVDHRQMYAQIGEWDRFHEDCHLDIPYGDMINIIKLITLHPSIGIIGLTGRPEKMRSITMNWLSNQGLMFDHLFMRPNDDYSKDLDLKISALEEFFQSKMGVLNSVLCVFDDRDKLVEGLRNYGLTVLQPRLGTY